MKKTVLLLCSFLFVTLMYAQQVTLSGKHLNFYHNSQLDKNLEAYTVFAIDITPFLSAAAADPTAVDLNIELEDMPALIAKAVPSKLLSDRYFTAVGNDKYRSVDKIRPEVYPFTASNLALTVADQFLYGSFKNEGHTYFIEPLWYYDRTQDKNLFLVYEKSAVLELEGTFSCGVIETEHQKDLIKPTHESGQDGPGHGNELCLPRILELAIASDYSMLVFYGSVSAVVAHNIAVMNAVQGNYDNEFAQPIIFNIVTQWVSPSIDKNPSNSTDYAIYLNDFRLWAEAGGFGVGITYDLGHIRTHQPFIVPGGQVLGVAYINGLCTPARYCALSEYTDILCRLQKTTAHETGHSFGAQHTPTGIMLQGAFCSDIWHPTSVTEINTGLTNATCMPQTYCPSSFLFIPSTMTTLCFNEEECHTYNLPCVTGISVQNSNPALQVTVTGTTICLKALVDGFYTVKIGVSPIDVCGNIGAENIWMINVTPSYFECDQFNGESLDRQQSDFNDSGIDIRRFNEHITIEDKALDMRNKQIEIFDLSGHLLVAKNSSDQFIQIPIDQLPAGMLIARINAGNQVITKKLVHF